LSIRATQFIVDVSERELYETWVKPTGRPKGLTIEEALRLCLCWLRPYPGSWHDKHSYDESDWPPWRQPAAAATPATKEPGWPHRSRRNRTLSWSTTKSSTTPTSLPYALASSTPLRISKNWRIIASRYCGELTDRFDNIVLTVASLQAINDRFSTRKLSFARLTKD
jgi:hypothetical protein